MPIAWIVELCIVAIVLICICIVVKWFVEYMQVPAPINMIILLLVGLLCLLVFLNKTGLLAGHLTGTR
jgi:F0F1-type ATP synthase assembly protein I